MINLTRKKIGIYCRDWIWGETCFDHIVSQIPLGMIKVKRKSRYDMYCELFNGDIIRVVRASENARGHKFTDAIVQDGVSNKILRNIIYPSVLSPVAVVSNIEDIVANYVTIKQELPRHRKNRIFKVVIRY